MGIFTTALWNYKIRQILSENTSPYFQSVSLVIWPLTLMNRTHFSELFISRFFHVHKKRALLMYVENLEIDNSLKNSCFHQSKRPDNKWYAVELRWGIFTENLKYFLIPSSVRIYDPLTAGALTACEATSEGAHEERAWERSDVIKSSLLFHKIFLMLHFKEAETRFNWFILQLGKFVWNWRLY